MPCVLDAWLAARCGGNFSGDLAAAVRAEQTLRLSRTLGYALTHSSFYRERFRGLPAPEAFTLENLSLLPFTTAEDLADWKNFLCVSQSAVERMVTLTTSGTTGPAKRLAFTRCDLEATKDFFQAGLSQLVRPGERALILWPGAARPDGVTALLREALGAYGVTAFSGEPLADTESLGRELALYNPHVIIAAPRQLAPLVELFPRKSAPKKLALSGILSSAEPLSPALAEALQKEQGLVVLDHYGLTETGYGGGVECPAHDGMHLRELDMLVEIVDAVTGEALPEGREGEVVITTFREAMPLIRYRTGDWAAILPPPCRCGSPLRRLSAVKGRITRHGGTISLKHPNKGAFFKNEKPASI